MHTPLIGDVLLVREAGVVPAPRIKAECLQTGGSIEYRGVLHWLLRRLGDRKGLVFDGPAHRLLACARAAQSQRLSFLALCGTTLPSCCRELILGCGGAVDENVEPSRLAAAAKATGYHVVPGVENEEFGLGLATLGWELGQELPSDLAKVYVSPEWLAPPITAGLSACGHGARVVAVAARSNEKDLQRALLEGKNLHSERDGIAALGQALADGDVEGACAILSC